MSDQSQNNKKIIRCTVTSSSTGLSEEIRKKWLAKKADTLRKEKEQQQKQKQAEKNRQLKLVETKSQRNYESSLKFKEWQERKEKEDAKKRQSKLLNKFQEPKLEPDLEEKRKEIFQKWVQMKLDKEDSERKRLEMRQKVVDAHRESRKFLAEVSYQHWKESVKSRNIVIPRNGFQVFGPKPKPVVVKEWVTWDEALPDSS